MSVSRRNLVLKGLSAATVSTVSAFGSAPSETRVFDGNNPSKSFVLHPVGRVEKTNKSVELRIFTEYMDALKGLDGFSHIFVLYWFDKNDTPQKRSILQVHPRGNKKNPLTGVFACRSPARPNLIALSLCRIRSVKDRVIHVDKIDAFNGTPILDIKPYIPSIDSVPKNALVPPERKSNDDSSCEPSRTRS